MHCLLCSRTSDPHTTARCDGDIAGIEESNSLFQPLHPALEISRVRPRKKKNNLSYSREAMWLMTNRNIILSFFTLPTILATLETALLNKANPRANAEKNQYLKGKENHNF